MCRDTYDLPISFIIVVGLNQDDTGPKALSVNSIFLKLASRKLLVAITMPPTRS